MTPNDLRAHIEARIAELEEIDERVRTAYVPSWSNPHKDPVHASLSGDRYGQLTAYRDVLERLPEPVEALEPPQILQLPASSSA